MSALELLRQAYLVALAEIHAAIPPPPPESEDASDTPPVVAEDDSDTATVVAEDTGDTEDTVSTAGLTVRAVPFEDREGFHTPPRLPLQRMNAGLLGRAPTTNLLARRGRVPPLRRQTEEVENAEGWIPRNIERTVHDPIYGRILADLGGDDVTQERVLAALERAIDNESVPGEMIRPYVAPIARRDGLGQSFRFDLLNETEAALNPAARPISAIDGLTRSVVLDYIACHYVLHTTEHSGDAYDAAKAQQISIYDNIVGLIIK